MITATDMTRDLIHALDAGRWASSLGFNLDPWQQEFVGSDAKQVILAAGRQTGKSLACSIISAHTAIFEPKSLIVMVAPSLRQSQLLITETREIIRKAGSVGVDAESTTRLQLGNGSKILSLPGSGNTIRGVSGVRLLICDEAAFIDGEVYQAVLPMQASNPRARLVLASSPNGRSGNFFGEQWHDGGDDWERYHIKSSDCPRISPEFLERQKLALTSAQFRQEFEASFEDATGAVFNTDDLLALHDGSLETWDI